MKHFNVDIAIVGGGLAGGLAALALAHNDFSCAVIDAVDPSSMQDSAFDGRTTAIAYASARVFMRLGLWKDIAPVAEPINDILVTNGDLPSPGKKLASASQFLHFDSRELDDDTPLGWIVENRHLRQTIFKAIRAHKNISLLAPNLNKSTQIRKGDATLFLDDGTVINAALIIGADGKTSRLRAERNIKVNRWAYKQTGIVTTIGHELPHRGVAQELFLPSGPFAILPMTENRSSLVWTENETAAPAYMALDNASFLEEISKRTGLYLGKLTLDGPRWSYPLSFHLSQSFIAPRLALIGDAARAIHPIAGQGYNLGVKDIAALAQVLREARETGQDIGHLTVLKRYQSWRRFDSTILALGTDALNRLFSNDIGPLRIARSLGLGGVNAINPLRKFFMRQAGADMGALPELMTRIL